MADSLQDQLRALGLAGEEPSPRRQAKQPPGGATKKGGGRKRPKPVGELSLDQAYALRQREEQQQAQRARQQKQEQDRLRRQLNKAIREIVNARRQNRVDAELARNFMFNGRIRKIYVTTQQQEALNAGQLGIAYLSGTYHLLDPEALGAVREISAEHVVDLGLDRSDDDPEHPVPDDLVW